MIPGYPNFNPELHRELFTVTNELRELSTKNLTWDQYRVIFSRLCDSLSQSLKGGLEEAIAYVASGDAKNPQAEQELRRLFQQQEAFIAFLNFERSVLKECGVDEKTTNDIVEKIGVVREQLRGIPVQIDAAATIAGLRDLRDLSCKAKDALEWRLEQAKWDHKVSSITMKVYGACLATGNLLVLGVTLGATAVPSTVSVGFGTLMLTLEGKLKEPGAKRPKRRR